MSNVVRGVVAVAILAGCNSEPTAPLDRSPLVLGPVDIGGLELANDSPIEVIERREGALHCWLVTFEGGGHLDLIFPTDAGLIPGTPIRFAPEDEWRTLDATMQSGVANNPSGDIVAFWTGPNRARVIFNSPMFLVRGAYASLNRIDLLDGGDFVGSFPANVQPDGFTQWDEFNYQSDDNLISEFGILGTSSATGIDDFEACRIEFIPVQIDIKPGSDPNCFNNDGNGVIPVAILGSADFDVTLVDSATVQLEGMAVRAVGKADKLQANIEDVNGDGFDDLVLQIEDTDGTFTSGSGTATLTGQLLDGTPIEGSDEICVVP